MSLLEVNKITPQSGTTLTLGDSGDTINFGSGVLPNFENLTVTGDLTVDTNSLYVDSTNNRVGIGTASPQSELHIVDSSANAVLRLESSDTGSGNINFDDQSATNRGRIIYDHSDDSMRLTTNASERMRIDSSGNVGIGTTSPTAQLEVVDDTADGITARFTNSNANNDGAYIDLYKDSSSPADNDVTGTIRFRSNDSGGTPHNIGVIQVVTTDVTDGTEDGYMAFSTRASGSTGERMRIDSSGHFLFAKTSTSSSVAGIRFAGDAPGYAEFTRDGGNPLYLNRETNDGDIIRFAKDDTTRGSIGIGDNDLFIGKTDGGTDCYLRFGFSNSQIIPASSSGGTNDNTLDLGAPTSRFNDLYMGGNIYLGGTGSANGLDTYEEGSWTPSLISSGGSISVSYGTRLGKYTRVGNIVHCSFSMRVASHSGGSGEYRVSGLPFTSNTAGNDHIGVTTAGLEGHPFTASTQLLQVIDNLSTRIRLLRGNNNSSWNSYTPTSGNSVYMSFTYPINQ